MWEFEVEFVETGRIDIIYGYSLGDACRRIGVEPEEVYVLVKTYID